MQQRPTVAGQCMFFAAALVNSMSAEYLERQQQLQLYLR